MRSRLAGVFQAGSVTRMGCSSALQLRTFFSAWRTIYGIILKSVTWWGTREEPRQSYSRNMQEERRLYALNPSLMGFPICMFSRQTDGPCCPMYSLLSSLGGEDSASAPASVMATSPSRATGRKPYDVGMIAFGVSSPAYPARSVDVPMSSTRAETSSGRAECQRQARNPLLYREHTASVLHHPGGLVEMCSGIPIESKICFSTVRIIFQKHSRFRPTKEKG